MRIVAFGGSATSVADRVDTAVEHLALAFVAAELEVSNQVVAFVGSDSFRKFGKKFALLSCLIL